jgi:hypothetical protein
MTLHSTPGGRDGHETKTLQADQAPCRLSEKSKLLNARTGCVFENRGCAIGNSLTL